MTFNLGRPMRSRMLLSLAACLFVLAAIGDCQTRWCHAQEEKKEDASPAQEKSAADADAKKEDEDAEEENRKAPPGLRFYMFREVAQTMHFSQAGWLMRQTRESEEHCSLVLSKMGLKPGMTIGDVGCGNGFYTLAMAKAVGKEGVIHAVDIQPQMLRMLRTRTKKEKIDNVKPILGTIIDPKLPEDSCDLILCVDVYHEFSHPEHMLAAMRKALKKDGLLLLVEFRAEDPKVPIRPEHKMTKDQVFKELEANGFKFEKEFDKLPWQHMLFFSRDEKFEPSKKPSELDLPDEKKGTIR
jgi:SAM-dependent methyltransferase